MSKNNGRLTIQVKEFPNEDIKGFLDYIGGQLIAQGGLYAVDIINPKGVYRVYKSKLKKNYWTKES